DLPEPETPVSTTSFFLGIATSTPFRLCSRAPRISTWSSSKLFMATTNSERWGKSKGEPADGPDLSCPIESNGDRSASLKPAHGAADASFPSPVAAVYGEVATREPIQPSVAERDTNRMLRTNLSSTTLSAARVSSRLTASKSAGYRWAT